MANKKAVETPIDIMTMSLEQLQAHSQSQSEKIEGLTAEAAELSAKVEALTSEATKSATKIEALTTAATESAAQIAELTEEVAELTKINEELVAKSELTAGLKADVYLHEGVPHKAISPKFNYKGSIITAKEIEGNAELIAELVKCAMLTPLETQA